EVKELFCALLLSVGPGTDPSFTALQTLLEATTRPKHLPTRLALQHFDATYSVQLGQLWPSVRVALLSERKYGALFNNFSNNPDLEKLQAQGCRDFISNGEGFLCVNDSSVSRTSRLKRVLHSYIPKPLLTDDKLRITSFDGTMWGEIERNSFDRVCYTIMFILLH
ncbi:hypothetical protein GOODEAATRI_006095, partial [Goodea atripinnis]